MEKLNFEFTGRLTSVKPLSDKMTLCKCFILALGKNANKSEITLEAVQRALPSLYNIPVVGHLFINDNGEVVMGGHDVEIRNDADGAMHLKSVTVPYGTVPMQDNVHFETVTEDGIQKDYLVAEVILWTGKFPELLGAYIDNEVYFKQSMEIFPTRYHKDKDYQVIDDFEFSALCLLGGGVAPCFKSARVEPYKFSDDNENFSLLFSEMKDEIAKCFSVKNEEKKGGEGPLLTQEIIDSIASKYGIGDTIPFEITEDMTPEVLEQKFQEFAMSVNNDEEQEELVKPKAEEIEDKPAEFAADGEDKGEKTPDEPQLEETPTLFQADLTAKELSRKMDDELEKATYNDAETYIWYTLADWSDEYIYAHKYYDAMDPSKRTDGFVRLPYAVDADNNLVIDFTKEESVRLVWLTKADEAKLAEKDGELETLRTYKDAREANDLAKEKAAILAEFTDLEPVEQFREVVAHLGDFAPDALREKCYALRGQFVTKPGNDVQIQSYKIPVGAGIKEVNKVDEFMKKHLTKN